jgi:hypothetical protein
VEKIFDPGTMGISSPGSKCTCLDLTSLRTASKFLHLCHVLKFGYLFDRDQQSGQDSQVVGIAMNEDLRPSSVVFHPVVGNYPSVCIAHQILTKHFDAVVFLTLIHEHLEPGMRLLAEMFANNEILIGKLFRLVLVVIHICRFPQEILERTFSQGV